MYKYHGYYKFRTFIVSILITIVLIILCSKQFHLLGTGRDIIRSGRRVSAHRTRHVDPMLG